MTVIEFTMFFILGGINIFYASTIAKMKNESIKKDAFIFQIALAVAFLVQAIKTVYSL